MIKLTNGDLIQVSAIRYVIGGVVGIECGSSSLKFKPDSDADLAIIQQALEGKS